MRFRLSPLALNNVDLEWGSDDAMNAGMLHPAGGYYVVTFLKWPSQEIF
jgi:hypothetical protein